MDINEQKKEIIDQINFMKSTSFEEILLIFKSAASLYFRSVITFGFNCKESKECINVLKEMYKIILKERKLLNIIKINIDSIDLDDTSLVIDMLDSLNDNTYLAYDSVLTEIETSCDLQSDDRCLRPRMGIDSLLTNNEYEGKVIKLVKKL